MTTLEETTMALRCAEDEMSNEAQLAAVAFLARYSGRTLEAYRHDLRAFFQWATDRRLTVLKATRPHIELYRAAMEERGLAASTIDRRLSTVCGFYRFAHIDGRVASNPAQYVRRPKVHPPEGHGMDRSELGTFLFTAERFDRDHAALAVLLGLNGLRVTEACATNVEDLGFERDTAPCGSSARATSPPSSRSSRALREPSTSPSANATTGRSFDVATGSVSNGAPPTAGCAPSPSAPGSDPYIPTCSEPRSSWPPSTPEYRFVTCRSQHGTPIREPPPSTTADARTSTDTPPTLSWPSLPVADGSRSSPRGTSGIHG